ncbi:C-GCAxxG-C-C family protein [Adlercreutzia sp. ZJ473]|uniref:C-GCAxxG-C-C family protein n=1 Tax=Adlercreutzia sp. ZJ473 TaxID=2722822 RepID=UPI0015554F4E|nr:C-GCAxxG-C-C family protein [Adlercreutzia sp. ZJ473]
MGKDKKTKKGQKDMSCEAAPKNCVQFMLMRYRGEVGLKPKQAMRLGEPLGHGMAHGGTCGALIAALMLTGLAGRADATEPMVHAFQRELGFLTCSDLMRHHVSCNACIKKGCALVDEVLEG